MLLSAILIRYIVEAKQQLLLIRRVFYLLLCRILFEGISAFSYVANGSPRFLLPPLHCKNYRRVLHSQQLSKFVRVINPLAESLNTAFVKYDEHQRSAQPVPHPQQHAAAHPQSLHQPQQYSATPTHEHSAASPLPQSATHPQEYAATQPQQHAVQQQHPPAQPQQPLAGQGQFGHGVAHYPGTQL